MRKYVKIIGLVMVAGIIAAIALYLFVYNKPHPDYAKAHPDFVLTADVLFHSYQSGESASANYTGAVLQVTGTIHKVESAGDQVIAVTVFEEGLFGDEGIRYAMLPDYQQNILQLSTGATLVIKGLCTGYNDTDVILEKCSIIE